MRGLVVFGALLGCGVLSTVAAGAPILVFNTGQTASGSGVLADGTVGDPHYVLVGAPASLGSSPAAVRVKTSASGWPVGSWVGDSRGSAWIGPDTGAEMQGPSGEYDYRTTFVTPGAGVVTLSGRWAADDAGAGIAVDGVSYGSPAAGYGAYTDFSIVAPVVGGVNTIDFLVSNTGAPTGVRVEFAGANFVAAAGVPEPGVVGMVGVGAVVLAGRRRRK